MEDQDIDDLNKGPEDINERERKKRRVGGVEDDVTAASILHVAQYMIHSKVPSNKEQYTETDDRKFREFFGCSPVVAATLWRRIQIEIEHAPLVQGGTIQHMLWSLLLMKKYDTDGLMAKICDADEKTIRKRSWPFISAIAELDGHVVSFSV